ncbi:CheR family methyltransferase [Candidatus Magnetaquicoccus inordinatus]|uniref:CheR family methyltransferase n=1 Tax=Candidatus Magnetaquicoccus inordinatus TaxID=2496818 RepID=UPI00102C20E8|nr:CheR family methyltransferase [Candidatus Magnetaquicoccus inordinatus]
MKEIEIEEVEITLFLEALRLRHGYDFRHYSRASLRRRLLGLQRLFGVEHLLDLLPGLMREEGMLARILAALSVPVTEMFRDPEVFLALRQQVVPILRSFPRINIWQIGSATGEEAYSLAIVMAEEGCLSQCQIYATDINDAALATAEAGIFPVRKMAAYSENYRLAGGKGRLSDYCHAHLDVVEMNEPLRRAMVFAHHNLEADGVFCEAHLVMCRNVLIYFDRYLQGRCLALIRESLVRGGYLCLGLQETMDAYEKKEDFYPLERMLRIYRLRSEGVVR